jgi:hypothetical protein
VFKVHKVSRVFRALAVKLELQYVQFIFDSKTLLADHDLFHLRDRQVSG